MLWTLCLVNCLLLFPSFFSGFSLALSIEASSSVFSFCLSLSVSMKLGETVAYGDLEGVFLCGSIPIQSVCA